MPAANNIRQTLTRFASLLTGRWHSRHQSRIAILGVGGCGGNLICHAKSHSDLDFTGIVCDSDIQNLDSRKDVIKVVLDRNDTMETGIRQAAEEILRLKPETVIIAAGAGGRTGSVAAPAIAKIIKDKGILTMAAVTTPFLNEGTASEAAAAKCISDLKEYSDGLFIINNRLMAESYSKASITDYFEEICEMFTHFVGCIAAMNRK